MPEGTDRLLVQDALLIDGLGNTPKQTSIHVMKGEIVEVEKTIETPAGATVLDAKGKVVMPGMIDCHTHLIYAGHRTMSDYKDITLEYNVILAILNAKLLLEAGFTTIRDVGSRGRIAVAIRNAIEKGLIVGPSVKASGRFICTTGGLDDYEQGLSPTPNSPDSLFLRADGPAEVLRAVREMVKEDVDNIKMDSSGGGPNPRAGLSMPTASYEEIALAVAEAHRKKRTVAVHAESPEAVKTAVKAGTDTIEHGTILDAEAILLMREHGTFLIPTLGCYYGRIARGVGAGLPEFIINRAKEVWPLHKQSITKAHEAGVKIANGSDAGGIHYPQGDNAWELELLVKHCGFTEMEAIMAATSVAAQALKIESVGSIEKGKQADMLVIDGNPLEDIAVLRDKRRILHIIKNGKQCS